jgi:hypothetical protein
MLSTIQHHFVTTIRVVTLGRSKTGKGVLSHRAPKAECKVALGVCLVCNRRYRFLFSDRGNCGDSSASLMRGPWDIAKWGCLVLTKGCRCHYLWVGMSQNLKREIFILRWRLI